MKVTTLKKAISAFVLTTMVGTTIMGTTVHAAGVPVIDTANVAQAVAQVTNQVQQIKQLRDQIKAATDNGNYGDLLQNPLIRKQLNKYLPKGYNDIFEAARRGDLGALDKVVKAAEQAEKRAQTAQTGAARQAAVQVQAEAMVTARYNRLNQYAADVEGLINQINRTANTAQKQDLTNALMGRSAQIQMEIGLIQLDMQRAAQQKERAAEQRIRELGNERLGGR